MALSAPSPAQPKGATGVLVLADGTVVWGKGFGAAGAAVGEVCFNTAMTGYQEALTDPSYAAQIITFTFPHIGNVGANAEDIESTVEAAVGCVVREEVTRHSSFRAEREFAEWMQQVGKIGISGVDTRALTRRIRVLGAPNAVIAHDPAGQFDIPGLLERARDWPGLEGMDLARRVSREKHHGWEGGPWELGGGYSQVPFASSEVERPRTRVSTSLDTNGEGLVAVIPRPPARRARHPSAAPARPRRQAPRTHRR